MEMQKTAITGVGGILAIFTLEKFNVILGTVSGLLTIALLSVQLFRLLQRRK
jgi:hypothetical protein